MVEYSYKPLNLSSNIDYDFLKVIETGADLHFYLTEKNQEYLNKAGYTSLYSVKTSDCLNKIKKYATEIQKISKKTEGTGFVEHHTLQENVYESVFANGCKIITNYTQSSIEINGNQVEAMSYIIIEEEA